MTILHAEGLEVVISVLQNRAIKQHYLTLMVVSLNYMGRWFQILRTERCRSRSWPVFRY